VMTSLSLSIFLNWRNVTDSGSFTNVAGTGELRYNGTTDLVNGNAVTSGEAGCTPVSGSTYADGVERETTTTYYVPTTLAQNEYTEHHFAIDGGNSVAGKEYEFRAWDDADLVEIGVLACTITMTAGNVTELSGSRIANATRTWQAAENVDVIDWPVGDAFILASAIENNSGSSSSDSLVWRWRVDAGSWNTLNTTGEIHTNATTDLVDLNAVTSGEAGCTAVTASTYADGIEMENRLAGYTPVQADDTWREIHIAVDTSGATAEGVYEFELYNSTVGVSVGTLAVSITMVYPSETVIIDEMALTYTGQAVETIAAETVTIDQMDLTWGGQNVDVAKTVVVDTDATSGDYASLAAFQSGYTPKDLTADRMILTVECQATTGVADSANATFSGWTTDVLHNLTVRQADSDRHGARWAPGSYRIGNSGLSNSSVMDIESDYVTIDGLQFYRDTPTGNGGPLIAVNGGAVGILVDRCVFKPHVDASWWMWSFDTNEADNEVVVQNCLFLPFGTMAGYQHVYNNQASGFTHLYNNTFVCNGNTAVRLGNTSSEAINNITRGHTDGNGFLGTYSAASDFNSSEDTTAIGINATMTSGSPWDSSATADVDIFVDATNGDYRSWIGNIFDGVGDNLYSSFTYDLADGYRPNAAFTLGALEATVVGIGKQDLTWTGQAVEAIEALEFGDVVQSMSDYDNIDFITITLCRRKPPDTGRVDGYGQRRGRPERR